MIQDIINKMRQMKLHGMVRAYQTSIEGKELSEMTSDELVGFLTESEWDDRHNRAVERRIQNAKFRYNASIESLHYDGNRSLDRNQMMRYAECAFIQRHENILITGSTGIGKSHISSAIGYQACTLGYRVMYASASKLFARLRLSKNDGTYIREISKIERQDLLIIDDFGLHPLDNHNRAALMEIMEDRHEKKSTIITAQLPVNAWHDVIGERTVADAILDRLVHNAHRIELKGESLRKEKQQNMTYIN